MSSMTWDRVNVDHRQLSPSRSGESVDDDLGVYEDDESTRPKPTAHRCNIPNGVDFYLICLEKNVCWDLPRAWCVDTCSVLGSFHA
jgi:hypothetical protein